LNDDYLETKGHGEWFAEVLMKYRAITLTSAFFLSSLERYW